MDAYQVEQSNSVKGWFVVAPVDGSPTSDIARLAEAFSDNRFSYREHGFLMSSITLRNFMKAHRYGCKSDGRVVKWESPDSMKFHTFKAKHPAKALRCIAQGG